MSNDYKAFFKAARAARTGQKTTTVPTKGPEMQAKRRAEPTEEQLRQRIKVRPAKKSGPKFSVISLLVLGMFCTLLGWWTVDPSLPDQFMSQVEVRVFGRASAESSPAAKTSQSKIVAPAENAQGSKNAAADQKSEEARASNEDVSYLAGLRERSRALDLREKELNELEEELQKQKVEIDQRIKKLEELRGQIASVLKERVEVDQERVNKLVETYSNMKPKQAAEIISGIDEDLAVEVLGKMKKKNAAEIMNLLEPGKARTLSERYAGYKTR